MGRLFSFRLSDRHPLRPYHEHRLVAFCYFLFCLNAVFKGVHGGKDKITLQFLTRTQTNPQVCEVLMSFGGVVLSEA